MRTNIGVIGKTKEEAEDKLKEIYSSLDKSIVSRVTKDRIILNDGGRIIALELNHGARGHRFNEVYVSKKIERDDVYWMTILPCLRQRSFMDGNNTYYEGGFSNWDWRYHVRYF